MNQNRSEKKIQICLSSPLAGLKILESPNSPAKFEFSPHEGFSHFLQSLENSADHVFHLFKLKFSVLTFLVLLVKEKYQKNKKLQGFRSCCPEAGSICISSPPNRVLPETFGRSGQPCSHQVVIKASGIPLGSHIHFVSSVPMFVP